MQIHLNETLAQRLAQIAQAHGQQVDELVEGVLEDFLQTVTPPEDFTAHIDRIMQEHRWLLDELAKQ